MKQIVGSTLSDLQKDEKDSESLTDLKTNFESEKSSEYYAKLYAEDGLMGGHVIMLGADDASKTAAIAALRVAPGTLQLGGGVNTENAAEYLDAGASHVIVTSFVFREGTIDHERLKELVKEVGKERLVLDLSCRRKEDGLYYVVTDRWQRWSDLVVNEDTLSMLSESCDEFLVHGVDVEGMRLGIDDELVEILGKFSPVPVTYAGGASTLEDLERVKRLGKGRVDITVGSALDIFGGNLPYKTVVQWHRDQLGTDQEGNSANSKYGTEQDDGSILYKF